MLDMNAHSSFDGERLRQIVAKGSAKAMVRSAAYVRKVATRKVRRSKSRKSLPGMPPKAHSNVFKRSILFAMTAGNTNAVIGPTRLTSHRTNAQGMPVPEILEEGGQAAPGVNPFWATSMRDRPNGNSGSDITRFFMNRGYGPAYWGTTASSVHAKARRGGRGKSQQKARGGKRGQYQTYRRKSGKMNRRVYLQNIRIRTIQQAKRVRDTVLHVFGKPESTGGYVAPRPLMGPSLADSKTMIAEFFRNTMN